MRIVTEMSVSEDDSRKCHLATYDHDKINGSPHRPVQLYQVTHSRPLKGLPPNVVIAYCIAPDEGGAIAQTLGMMFGENECHYDSDLADEVTSTAHRVPFYMRGWGSTTF